MRIGILAVSIALSLIGAPSVVFGQRPSSTPESFGAKGDGVVDDSPSIMAAARSFGDHGGILQLRCDRQYLIGSTIDLSRSPGVTIQGCLAAPDDPSAFRGFDGNLTTLGAIIRAPSAKIVIGRDSGLRSVLLRQAGLAIPASSVNAFDGTAIMTAAGGAGQAAVIENVMVIGAAICLDDSNGGNRLHIDGFFCDGADGEIIGPSYDTSTVTNIHNWPFATAGANPILRSGVGLEVVGASDDTVFGGIFDFGHRIGFRFDSSGYGKFHVGHIWADGNGEACVRIAGGRGINIASLTTYTCGISLDVEKGAEVQVSQAFLVGSDHECVRLDGTLSFALLHLERCHGGGIRVASPSSVLSVGFLQVLGLHGPWTISVPPGFTSDHVGIAKLFTDAPGGGSLYEGEGPLDPAVAAAPVLELPPNADAIRLDGRGVVQTLRGGWGGRVLTVTTASRTSAIAAGGNVALTGGVAFGGRVGALLALRYDAACGCWRETSRSLP